jgi:hypothetical protein
MAACSNPSQYGPGRVDLKLESAAVQTVEHSVLFGDATYAQAKRSDRQVVHFKVSSRTDLLRYFREWEREIQVRCSVDGNLNGRSYRGFALGPFREGANVSGNTGRTDAPPPQPAEQYLYSIYAFIDLVANDVEYQDGKPASTLNLKVDHFESLRCYLLGVTKGPVLFPKSNDISVQANQFRALYDRATKQ